MKKIVSIIAMTLLLSGVYSCQDNGIDSGQALQQTKLNITATFASSPMTRVTYDVDNTSEPHSITPAWTKTTDKIFGFDDLGQTFTFTVVSVDGNGVATFDDGGYVPGAAKTAYAIYAPGKTVADFAGEGTSRTLSVNLSTQSGELDDMTPVLMCATGDIDAGNVTFTFENQTAIIGVTKFKLDAPASTSLSTLILDGAVTTGHFGVSGSAMTLTAETKGAVTASGTWTTDADSLCATPIYFAVLPTAGANLVLNGVDASSNNYANLSAIASTNIEAGNYYYMAKKLNGPVADVNGVKYATIEEAFAAANRSDEDVTVTLLENCEASESLIVNTEGAAGSGAITLDLASYILTGVTSANSISITGREFTVTGSTGKLTTSSTSKFTLNADASSTVTIAGGTIESTGYSAVGCLSGSTVEVTGGTITSTARRGIQMNGGSVTILDGMISSTCTTATSAKPQAAIFQTGGSLDIKGGTITATQNYCAGVWCSGKNPVLTMSDGIINGYWGIFQNNGANSITISDGTVSGSNRSIYIKDSSTATISKGVFSSTDNVVIDVTEGTATISGGTFNRTGGNVIYTRSETSRANITGGVFSNTTANAAIYAKKGIVDVSGSCCISSVGVNPVDAAGTDAATGVAYVTGGCFNKPIQPDYAKSEGGAAQINILNSDMATKETYPYTVTPVAATPKVATVTQGDYSWEHGTIASAVKCADARAKGYGAATIALNGNCSATASLFINEGNSYSVTMNLNGFAITSTASPALSVGSNYTLKDTGGDGDFITTGEIAIAILNGTSIIQSGSVVGASDAISLTGGALSITGGYLYGGVTEDINKTEGTLSITGGLFRNNPTTWLADGYTSESLSWPYNIRTYSYHAIQAGDVASVDGVNYPSLYSAISVAKAYNGGSSSVTIQLLQDVTGWSERVNLTNANSKTIVLDLNGHIFGGVIDSILTTTGTMTITDGLGTGKYTSNKRNQIYLGGSGTVNIDHCTIECTRGGYYDTGIPYTMISVYGDSSHKDGRVNISNSKVYSTSFLKPFYVSYGTLDFDDSEVTCGTSETGGYMCVDVYTGGKITVDETSFLSFDRKSTGAKYGCIHSRTGNTSKGSSVIINSGWFYSGKSLSVHSDHPEYGKIFTINGGYFNNDFTSDFNGDKNADMTSINYGTGKSLQDCSANHTHATTGAELTYTKKVDTTPTP